ncbi:capsular polysaccharide export protein, LipB/KpsS family [Acidiluteibacter ferrifornacis]|uniref:Uncharacterized protein n=1 Tax=Acidiluteibacter ferrifornacis TaxID=2692424 RepID=A0A6N9NJ46_9FLAO|nr:hypothetical protein [Acidiluteibacter ferrifornacis]NBG65879.1 hypothetical protein [Acidiluteibacter ferrifornacis]
MKKSKLLIIDLVCDQKINFDDFIDDYPQQLTEITYLNENETILRPYKVVEPINFNKIHQETYNQAFDEVTKLGEFTLSNGLSIAEELTLNDKKSLWYYFRFMLLYKHRKRIFEDRIYSEAILLNKEYKKVVIITSSSYLKGKINKEVEIKYLNQSETKDFTNILKFMIISICRFFIGLPKLFLFFKPFKRHILLSNANSEQNILSIKDFTIQKGDHFCEYLQDKIEYDTEYINISEYFPPKLTDSNKIKLSAHFFRSRHKNTVYMESLLYLQFLNPFFYISSIKAILKIFYSFKNIQKEEKKYPLLEEFKSYQRLCYFIGVRKSAIYWILKFTNYKTVASVNEHDSRVKSILDVATSLKIKTFGIQHGVIHYRHLHYCFSSFDSRFHPYPDYTFVWGDYWNKVLQKISTYTSDELINVGQLRTDIIPKLKNQYTNFISNDCKDSKTFTILYPSQPLYVGEEAMREKLAISILQLSVDLPNVQVVIKPHPKEKDCAEFFNQLASKLNTKNFVVLNEDLYKMIATSDLVIVYNSTVGAEAIYFRKPLVVMNYADNDFSGFIKNKVAKEVNNYEELRLVTQQVITHNQITSPENIDEFIKERAFKIDGEVAKRIINNVKNKSH